MAIFAAYPRPVALPHTRPALGLNLASRLATPSGWDLRHHWAYLPVRFRATAWRPANFGELQGLGNFLKKATKFVTRAAALPLKVINKNAYNKVVDTADKITDKVDAAYAKVQGGLQKFVKKNWKYIVIAAAVVATIYTMGGTAALVAKLTAAKTWIVAKAAAVKGWGVTKIAACVNGIKKMLGGQKMGELTPQEAEAVGSANEESGQNLIPDQVMACFGKKALTLEEQQAELQQEAADQAGVRISPQSLPAKAPGEKKSLPSWVIPAACAAGGLVLAMAFAGGGGK